VQPGPSRGIGSHSPSHCNACDRCSPCLGDGSQSDRERHWYVEHPEGLHHPDPSRAPTRRLIQYWPSPHAGSGDG
jgi:hypothetical protein